MPSIRDVAELSAEILKFTPAAAFSGVVSKFAGILPDDDDDTKKEKRRQWQVARIPEWKKLCRRLMDIPYTPEAKAEQLRATIRDDWFEFHGDPPKDKWVETLAENVYLGTLNDMKNEAIMGDG